MSPQFFCTIVLQKLVSLEICGNAECMSRPAFRQKTGKWNKSGGDFGWSKIGFLIFLSAIHGV